MRPATVVTGLAAGDQLVGIDFRPANQGLYGVGKLGFVYTIDKASAVATAVNAAPFTPAPNGTFFGVDFNPAADRLRVHSDGGQNLRIIPTDGTLAGGVADGNLNYAAGDPNAGRTPGITTSGYTNSLAPAPAMTVLYAIDITQKVLVTVNPPNNGVLNTVGALGIDLSTVAGFDIAGGEAGDASIQPTQAFAALALPGGPPKLYRINLETGAAQPAGDIGYASQIDGIAIEP